jgi:ABC-type Fe3+/spermidine/putrescine transport system ATPase subunit
MKLLEAEYLSKTYPEQSVKAVDQLSIHISEGELITLVGESGSGKTTLLRLLAGLDEAEEGRIELKGKQVEGPSKKLVPGHPDIKLVQQDYRLSPNLTVYENLTSALREYVAAYQHQRTMELLELARIVHLKDKLPREISGGEQQRVAILRGMATKPALLLLDEPLSHLDTQLKSRLKGEIVNLLRTTNTTALIVTHDMQDALSLGDKVVVMHGGKILQVGKPDQVYREPASLYVAGMFGHINLIPHYLLPSVFNEDQPQPPGVQAAVRPENIRIGYSEENPFDGIVMQRYFLGTHYELDVQVTESIHLKVFTVARHIGLAQKLPLWIKSEDIMLLQP